MIFIRSASDQMTYCRLELGLLAADLLSAAVEDAAQVQVVALLCRLEGHPESARRGLVDAGENQKLLALRVQIVHRQGTRWPTTRWADRGGARRGGQAPATRPGYTTASGENRWRGRRRGRLLRRHGARVSGPRLVRWARSAHRDTRRLDASATFWRRCPNVHLAEGRLEVGRYSDYGFICKFSETLTTRTVMAIRRLP